MESTEFENNNKTQFKGEKNISYNPIKKIVKHLIHFLLNIKYKNIVKMAPRMAAVLRAPGKLCSFSYVLFVFFVVLRVRCC